jgi:serine/threonine protein kinase
MSGATLHRRNFLLHLQERAGCNGPVLLKEPAYDRPTRSHLDQLHNEYAITRQLTDVAGVRPVYAKEGTESEPVLLMKYIQGQSLAELIRAGPLDLAEKLRLAVNATTVLSRIHEQQVMHKDLNSSNILVAGKKQEGSQGGVYVIDFGAASVMQQESASRLAADDTLVGTLAYISPEQTGRMNRSVDYRTDLYSLGVVLYELFTGQLPFESGDVLELIHDHIARQPRPPHEIERGIPPWPRTPKTATRPPTVCWPTSKVVLTNGKARAGLNRLSWAAMISPAACNSPRSFTVARPRSNTFRPSSIELLQNKPSFC